MPEVSGYSKKPLCDKLGIKAGFHICVLDAPDKFFEQTLVNLPPDVTISAQLGEALDLILFFAANQHALIDQFAMLKRSLKPAGSLWISWPKRSAKSKSPAELSDNVVRQIGLDQGLVDVKVCAIDAVWSGLKFVFRVADRALTNP